MTSFGVVFVLLSCLSVVLVCGMKFINIILNYPGVVNFVMCES